MSKSWNLSRFEYLVPVLIRLGVGLTMFFAGYSKVTGNHAGLVKTFATWGIPLPGIMAPFITYVELLGGLAILLGVATRVAGLLIACDMAVAILAVRWALVVKGGHFDFSQMRTETLLLVGGLALAAAGAGVLSLDRIVSRGKRGAAEKAA